jgi:hypothetical protein
MDDLVAAGDSAEQRAAELVMLDVLGRELGAVLLKRRFSPIRGTWTELDGVSDNPPILVEAWAHQGPPKSAQKAKVMTDAVKMVWVEAAFFPGGARKILLLSDAAAATHFRGASWMAAALTHFGIEVQVVDLPPGHRAAVQLAQNRQFR